MRSPNPVDTPKRTRAIERLAQKLYEQANANPDAKAWVWLGWDVRESWLIRARDSIDRGGSSFNWLFFRKILRGL